MLPTSGFREASKEWDSALLLIENILYVPDTKNVSKVSRRFRLRNLRKKLFFAQDLIQLFFHIFETRKCLYKEIAIYKIQKGTSYVTNEIFPDDCVIGT